MWLSPNPTPPANYVQALFGEVLYAGTVAASLIFSRTARATEAVSFGSFFFRPAELVLCLEVNHEVIS
jgi:hypothetical protein